MPQTSMTVNRLDIPGNRDEIVEECCAWQQKQAKREGQKADYHEACNYLIDNAMDLERSYQDHTVAAS